MSSSLIPRIRDLRISYLRFFDPSVSIFSFKRKPKIAGDQSNNPKNTIIIKQEVGIRENFHLLYYKT